ncbi:hypothetical protein SDC9_173500 [bioreactor metagenome]|uniref:Uncharacterized protein n=1 Tax=bioreactor metagenome TaxID=1076179 RepID=A0A645GGN1_9ZZZZ
MPLNCLALLVGLGLRLLQDGLCFFLGLCGNGCGRFAGGTVGLLHLIAGLFFHGSEPLLILRLLLMGFFVDAGGLVHLRLHSGGPVIHKFAHGLINEKPQQKIENHNIYQVQNNV